MFSMRHYRVVLCLCLAFGVSFGCSSVPPNQPMKIVESGKEEMREDGFEEIDQRQEVSCRNSVQQLSYNMKRVHFKRGAGYWTCYAPLMPISFGFGAAGTYAIRSLYVNPRTALEK